MTNKYDQKHKEKLQKEAREYYRKCDKNLFLKIKYNS